MLASTPGNCVYKAETREQGSWAQRHQRGGIYDSVHMLQPLTIIFNAIFAQQRTDDGGRGGKSSRKMPTVVVTGKCLLMMAGVHLERGQESGDFSTMYIIGSTSLKTGKTAKSVRTNRQLNSLHQRAYNFPTSAHGPRFREQSIRQPDVLPKIGFKTQPVTFESM